MEARDTMMSFERIQEIDMKNAESNFTDALWDVAKEQAEISFKAGIKQGQTIAKKNYLLGKGNGIREVIGWIETEDAIDRTKRGRWQAFLKEKGL